MSLTLDQAAQETGKRKRVISQAIKSKRLPAKKDQRGQWQIDPAQLFQAFPKEEMPEVREGGEQERPPAEPALEECLDPLEQEVHQA